MRKVLVSISSKRTKVDAVAKIVKRICGLSQSESFLIAKEACVFNIPTRYVGGKTASRKD